MSTRGQKIQQKSYKISCGKGAAGRGDLELMDPRDNTIVLLQSLSQTQQNLRQTHGRCVSATSIFTLLEGHTFKDKHAGLSYLPTYQCLAAATTLRSSPKRTERTNAFVGFVVPTNLPDFQQEDMRSIRRSCIVTCDSLYLPVCVL